MYACTPPRGRHPLGTRWGSDGGDVAWITTPTSRGWLVSTIARTASLLGIAAEGLASEEDGVTLPSPRSKKTLCCVSTAGLAGVVAAVDTDGARGEVASLG